MSPQHEASLIYTIGRVNHGIQREMRAALAEWRLSVQEFTALSVLSARPGLSNAQLARRALVTPQAMIEILRKLENRGLVSREAGPAHKRILRSELTQAGNALLSSASPQVRALQDSIFAPLSGDERRVVMQALRSAMDTLSESSRRI